MAANVASVTAGTSGPVAKPRNKGLHIALWVVQGLLGLAFAFAGVMKATRPFADLAVQMTWTTVLPWYLVRFIGVAELAGGLGLILPAATRIKPSLTPLAAAGLATIMVLAAIFHATRGELGAIGINVILGSLAAFVAWGRFVKEPIAPK